MEYILAFSQVRPWNESEEQEHEIQALMVSNLVKSMPIPMCTFMC